MASVCWPCISTASCIGILQIDGSPGMSTPPPPLPALLPTPGPCGQHLGHGKVPQSPTGSAEPRQPCLGTAWPRGQEAAPCLLRSKRLTSVPSLALAPALVSTLTLIPTSAPTVPLIRGHPSSYFILRSLFCLRPYFPIRSVLFPFRHPFSYPARICL